MSKNQRLNASITIGSVLDQSVRRNIGFIKSGLSSVGDEIKDVERKQRELGKQRKLLERQGQSVEALDREYEGLSRTLDQLRRQQERWNRAASASRRVGSTFNSMASDMVRNGRAVAIGLGIAGGAVFGFARGTAEAAKEITLMSEVANTSPVDFQKMAAAVETVGIEQDKLGDILKDVNDRVGDFLQTGGGPMADFFEKIGPKVGVTAEHFKELSGKDALQLYVSSLQKAGVSQQEMTFYMEAMASDSTLLVPLLRDNGRELERLGDRAEATGRILSQKALRDAQEFRAGMTDLRGVFVGLKNTIGVAFMPVVTKAMGRVGDALAGNREEVKVWATSFAGGVERALPVIGEVAVGIGNVLAITGEVVSTTAEMVGGWENFGILIGTVLAARTVIRIGKFGLAVFSLGRAMVALAASTPLVVGGIRAIGTALMMNPIGLAIAAIAGGAYLIYRNWDKVAPWFQDLWGDVRTYFGGAADFVGGVFLGDMDRAGHGLTTSWEGYKGIMARVVGGIGSVFDATWVSLIKPVTDALGVTEPIETAWSWVGGRLNDNISGIGTGFDLAWTTLIKPVVDGLSNTGGISGAWEAVKTALDPVLIWIGEKFSAVMVFIKPVIDALKWGVERAQAAGNIIGSALGHGVTPSKSAPVGGALQKNALGGPFRPGWHLTGELGPELKFENRSGYVANNRAMRQLASYADRIGSAGPTARAAGRTGGNLSRTQRSLLSHRTRPQGATQALSAMSARIEAALGEGAPQQAVAAASGEVTQHINNHFHASGVNAAELMEIAERKRRTQAQGALFDRAPVSGPFGR